MRQIWSAPEIRQLADRYEREGSTALAQEFGRSMDSVSSRARLLRLRSHHHRRHQAHRRATNNPTINARFFDEITPTSAWVAGVFWARARIKSRHRHVLKLRIPSDRKWVLTEVMKCMGSRHSVQITPRSVMVEICNSRLVSSFVDRIGQMPFAVEMAETLPQFSEDLLPSFAAGWLAARGEQSRHRISWSGPKPAVAGLSAEIQKQVDVGSPDWDFGTHHAAVTWSKPHEVATLRDWLNRQHCSDPPEATTVATI